MLAEDDHYGNAWPDMSANARPGPGETSSCASPALNNRQRGGCDSARIFAMPEKLTLINPPGLHPTSGYAHVTVAEVGRTAHLAGLCPLDAEERVVGVGDLDAQIDQVVANGITILAAVGARPADVVR